MPSPTCLANPPCHVGGFIDVGGALVELAPDVEVAGTGDNRIVSRNGRDWFSLYAMPEDFKLSGPTTEELAAEWADRMAQAPSVPPGARPGLGPLVAGFEFGPAALVGLAALVVVGLVTLERASNRTARTARQWEGYTA